MQRIKTVSYTHLDVYKRQISDKEEADKLEIDYNHYQYCKAVGAEELPF